MKKLLAILCVLALALGAAACGKSGGGADNQAGLTAPDGSPLTNPDGNAGTEEMTDANGKTIPSNIPGVAVTSMPEHFDAMEWALYGNIMSYKDQNDPSKGYGGDDYVGQQWIKQGTFAVLRDEYNQRDRYYVWGYADQTRCCDYQWEFVPADPASLPSPGSTIEVIGTFAASNDALDHFWITDAEVTVTNAYDTPAYDFDLTRCSPTLARVQIQNMQAFPEVFGGKTVLLFGRALNQNSVQHPYYDGSWSVDFQGADKTSATGTYIMVGGVFTAGENSGSYVQVSAYQEV